MAANTCPDCGGDGYDEGELCESCMGSGVVPATGLELFLKTKLEEIKTVVDAILTQVS